MAIKPCFKKGYKMATSKGNQNKNQSKKSEAKFHSLFTINTTKAGKLVVKPKLGKYGVKDISFTTNEGETISLDADDALFTTTKEGKSKNGKDYSITEAFLVQN